MFSNKLPDVLLVDEPQDCCNITDYLFDCSSFRVDFNFSNSPSFSLLPLVLRPSLRKYSRPSHCHFLTSSFTVSQSLAGEGKIDTMMGRLQTQKWETHHVLGTLESWDPSSQSLIPFSSFWGGCWEVYCTTSQWMWIIRSKEKTSARG